MYFTTGVILPARITKKTGQRIIRRAVEKLLFRFSEDFKLKPHIALCDCIAKSMSFHKTRSPIWKPEPDFIDCKGSGSPNH